MKGLQRSLSRAAAGRPSVPRVVTTTIRVKDLALSVDGATGVGFNAAVAADFPDANILFLAAVAYMRFSKQAGATGVQDAFDGDYSIGSTPTADATLSGTDANLVASSALGAATSGVSPVARGAGSTAVLLDNTDGSLELNLNLIIDDANISADDQPMLANGVIHIAYVVLGDD